MPCLQHTTSLQHTTKTFRHGKNEYILFFYANVHPYFIKRLWDLQSLSIKSKSVNRVVRLNYLIQTSLSLSLLHNLICVKHWPCLRPPSIQCAPYSFTSRFVCCNNGISAPSVLLTLDWTCLITIKESNSISMFVQLFSANSLTPSISVCASIASISLLLIHWLSPPTTWPLLFRSITPIFKDTHLDAS